MSWSFARVVERECERVTYTLDRARHDLEVRLDVAAEDTGLERFDVPSDVRLALEQVSVVHAVVRLDVTVRKDDVRLESLHLRDINQMSARRQKQGLLEVTSTNHEQRLAKGAGPFSEDLVGVERDDVAEREDERVNVFHVEVVCRDGVRDGVLREDLRLLGGVAAVPRFSTVGKMSRRREKVSRGHELRVELDRIVTQLGDRDGFETLRALRQVRVALDPAVKASTGPKSQCEGHLGSTRTKRNVSPHRKQSMCTQLRLLNSSSESLVKPISLYMSMPCTVARARRNGKSNESPL